MAVLKTKYGTLSSDIASGLNSLSNGSVQTSSAVDNSSDLAQDYLVEIYIDGTAATTAWLEVRVAPSTDGGTNYATWESAVPIGIIDLSVDLQRSVFSIAAAMFVAPQRFKILVKNNTGAALAGSGNYIKVQAVNNEAI